MSEPEHVVEEVTNSDGFTFSIRIIPEYDFCFQTYTKGRWLGRELLEVFANEFIAYEPEYYREVIESGGVTINGKTTTPDYVLKNMDQLEHTAPVQESPILNREATVIYENEDLLVVNKPASWPTHACGNYRLNSLAQILKHTKCHPIHRLDRQTSGVLILSKSQAANKFQNLLKTGSKRYLARVRGHFNIEDLEETDIVFKEADGFVRVNCYLQCHEKKVGIWGLADSPEKGKISTTRFRLVKSGADESLIECFPETGRTHQIRIHCQLLGFPISNDTYYGGQRMAHPSCPYLPFRNRKKPLHPDPERASGIFLHCQSVVLEDADQTYKFETPDPCWTLF